MLDEMKTSKSSTIGEKLSKYLIVKPIIFSRYKLWLGTEWTDKVEQELHIPIIKKFPLRRVMVSGPNEIWSADLIDMREFSNDNKDYNYLLNVIDIFGKYAWSVSWKLKLDQKLLKHLKVSSASVSLVRLWVCTWVYWTTTQVTKTTDFEWQS